MRLLSMSETSRYWAFLESEATGVDGAEEGVVVGGLHTSEQVPDFL